MTYQKLEDLVWTLVFFILSLLVLIHDGMVLTKNPRIKKLKKFYTLLIVGFLIFLSIYFIIISRDLLTDKNTFMNLMLFLLLLSVIIWYSYLVDRNIREKNVNKTVISITFTLDLFICILSFMLFIDAVTNNTYIINNFKKLF